MVAFLTAALPWVALGLAIVIAIIHFAAIARRRRRHLPDGSEHLETADEQGVEDDPGDYMPLGMVLGLCGGVALGAVFRGQLGESAISFGSCFGLLAGTLIGMSVKRKSI